MTIDMGHKGNKRLAGLKRGRCEEDGLDIFIASERLEVLIPERN
jgi:hypothetical protein